MSKLEELIKEFCSNGVEYKPLWSLTAWDKRFSGIDRSMQKKVVSYKYYLSSEFNEVERKDGDILYIPTGITNEKRYTTEELAGEYLAEGEMVCIPWGGTPNVKYHKGKFVTGDNRIATSLDTNILDNKYLYYWMQSKIDLIASFYRGAGIQHPSMKSVLELQIPLPALPVQREIVRILDSFTLYSAELTAELTARRKQYEFYRDKLLNFENFVEKRKLEECCNILDNKRKPITQSARVAGIYPYYGANGIQDYVAEYLFDGEFILVGEDGSVITENGNPIITWAVGKIWVNNHAHIIQNNGKVNFRFLFHYLHIIDIKKLVHGNIPKLTGKDFKELQIPIPPMDVQERIVKVLDNFDAICSDLGIGLPAEIEKRQKQYEYYRDKLLSFDINVDKVINTTGGGQPLIKLLQYVFGYAFVSLGYIGKVAMCKRILKTETTAQGDIPFYKIGTFGKIADAFITKEKFEEYKERYSYPKIGDILISAAGTIGKTVVFNGEPSYFQDSNIVWLEHDEKMVLNKYLFYIYQTNPWRVSAGGTIARIYNDNITKAIIPLPPLEKQKEIVEILDRFDNLCNDISKGLPAEIEARQKQYEYYRDKLLTF